MSAAKSRNVNVSFLRLWVMVFLFLTSRPLLAQDFQSVGIRGGVGFSSSTHNFQQLELFTDFNLPLVWNFYSDWNFKTRIDASAGWLSDNDPNGFIGSVGPVVELSKGNFPLTLEVGVSPTVLSRHQFSDKNFGDDFQFTSHAGINWNITKHVCLGYRFQHMSNAGIADSNPGLNVQMISISYLF